MRSYLKEKACCVGKKVSIYIKETGVSAHAAGKGFPILHTFPPAFAEYSLWVGDFPSDSVGLSPVERRIQSLPFAAVALAVGAKDAVRPLRACSCRREGTCNLIYSSACFCRTLPVDWT